MSEPKPTVLLTSAMHSDAVDILRQHAQLITAPDNSDDTLRQLSTAADGIIVRDKLPDDIFSFARNLKGVVRHGVGLDFIPVEAATEYGVPVANLPGSNTQAVAEYCISAMFHLRRPLKSLDDAHRKQGWGAARGMTSASSELAGSTLGIVGVGNIGRRLADIAKAAFGMKVLGVSRRSGQMPEGIEETTIEGVFEDSDAIAICCALTDETRGLVDANLLRRMKPHSILINVARGPIVRTDALIDALQAEQIGGACIDVYDKHPLATDSALFNVPNLIMTPHAASLTATTMRAMGIAAAEEMLRMLNGQKPRNLVNATAWRHHP